MKIAALFGHTANEWFNQPDSAWAIPDCTVGIELEYERYWDRLVELNLIDGRGTGEFINPAMRKYWAYHTDDSLRNYGIEFVSRAVYGKDLTQTCTELQTFFDSTPTIKPHVSRRCGLHIHVDIRDMTSEELSCFLAMYALYERMIFAVFGKNRETNSYCVPLYQTPSFFHSFKKVILAEGELEARKYFQDIFKNDNRYSAINLSSVMKHGSVEFRHSKSTTDIAYMKNWINVLLSLKSFSRGTSLEDLLEYITRIEFADLTPLVFKNGLHNVFQNISELDKKRMMLEGKKSAKISLGAMMSLDYLQRVPHSVKRKFSNFDPKGFSDEFLSCIKNPSLAEFIAKSALMRLNPTEKPSEIKLNEIQEEELNRLWRQMNEAPQPQQPAPQIRIRPQVQTQTITVNTAPRGNR